MEINMAWFQSTPANAEPGGHHQGDITCLHPMLYGLGTSHQPTWRKF